MTTSNFYSVIGTTISVLAFGIAFSVILTLYVKEKSAHAKTSTTATNNKQSYYCADVSLYTSWSILNNEVMTMSVNTSRCNFTSTPLYIISLAGITNHWDAGGYTTVSSPTPTSFQVYARPIISRTIASFFNNSQVQKWSINWFGITRTASLVM